MSNILEYIVNVRDQASSVMNRLGQGAVEVNNRLQGMQAESIRASSALRQMGAPVNTLQRQLEKLKNERGWLPASKIGTIRSYNREIAALERQINRLENTTGGATGRWFKEAFAAVPFAGLLTNPLVVAGALGGKAFSLGIQEELNKSAFEVFLGTETAAKKLMEDLGAIRMDKGALSEAAKQMLSFRVNEADVLPVLNSIADIAGGAKDKVASLALAYSQMSSTGKLLGQDLNQMINAGFNPLAQMSITTGKSIGVLKDEMGKGLITAEMVKQAFIDATAEGGQFNGMLAKQAETMGGKWTNIMTIGTNGLIAFSDFVSPVVNKLLDLGGAALDTTFNGLGWMVDKLREGHPVAVGIAAVLGVVTTSLMVMKTATLLQTGATKLLTFATNVTTAAWWANNAAMWANPVTWIVAGVIALIAALGYLIYKIDGWGEAWTNTVEAAKSLWSGTVNTFKTVWGGFYDLLMTGIEKIMLAWYKMKSAWGDEQAEQEIAIIEKRSEERKKALRETGEAAINDFANAWSSTKKAADALSWNDKGLGDMVGDLKSSLGISTPGLAGTASINSNIGGGGSSTTTSASAVATGGTKHNYITINLDKLIEVLNISGKDFKESTNDMADATQDALLRVLAMASTAGN